MTNAKLVVNTIKEFCASKGFTQIVPTVRFNTNGYPFVTFITGDNKAENIYMSKSLAPKFTDGSKLTKDNLQGVMIGFVKNEKGEERIKLISNSDRVSVDSLLD